MATQGSDIVASCGDAVVRDCDVQTLEPTNWLNDAIVSFYYEWLASNISKSEELPVLLPPSVVFLLASGIDPEVLGPIATSLKTAPLVFFPLNDSSDLDQAGGGTHWALMVFERSSNTFTLYDSMRGAMARTAQAVMAKTACAIGESAAGLVAAPKAPDFLENLQVPQQVNAYDCGCHMLALTEHLLQQSMEGIALNPKGVSSNKAHSIRGKCKDIINTLHGARAQGHE